MIAPILITDTLVLPLFNLIFINFPIQSFPFGNSYNFNHLVLPYDKKCYFFIANYVHRCAAASKIELNALYHW